MTKKKWKAIFVLTVAVFIVLIFATMLTGFIFLTLPLLILLCTCLIGWMIKGCIEWLIKNIDYKKVVKKTREQTQVVIKKTKIKDGVKIVKSSIEELRGTK